MAFTPKEALSTGDRAWRRNYMRQWRQQNRVREQQYKFKARYGITLTDFEELVHKQGGLCAICERPETGRHGSGHVRNLSVDHDHETGKIRGLLCHSCNRILGLLADDPHRLMRAVQYLNQGT